jgi:hypothetical protein
MQMVLYMMKTKRTILIKNKINKNNLYNFHIIIYNNILNNNECKTIRIP